MAVYGRKRSPVELATDGQSDDLLIFNGVVGGINRACF